MVPGDIGGYTSLGIILIHSKKYEEAEKELQKVHDEEIAKIDAAMKAKEAELMEV